jgi:3-deoxy-D-manno-octulosonate 8-phosphate phosphatase (KDO 8-P phosphatase)
MRASKTAGCAPGVKGEDRRAALAHALGALPLNSRLTRAFAQVKILLCDVDGVLTDASVWMGGAHELKRFNIRDGLGLLLLRRAGVRVGWVSARSSLATTQRAKDLKIDFLHQREGSKVEAIEAILARTRLVWEEVCYVGDDIVDLGALQRAGVAVAVANAVEEVKAIADYVTRAGGGHGAVREVVELILKAQHKWPHLLEAHLV